MKAFELPHRTGRRRGGSFRSRGPNRPGRRRGAAMVEAAIVLPVFLTLALGMVELAVTVLHEHIVTQAARQAARIAIVHGSMAPPEMNEWSPATMTTSGSPDYSYSVSGNDTGEMGTALAPYLTGLDLANTTITMDWLDGNGDLGSRVRVRVTTTHQPFVSFLFTSGWTLTGESTMEIAH